MLKFWILFHPTLAETLTLFLTNNSFLFRYTLERETLHELSHELRRLFTLGYRWSHAYTQCRLQAMLYSERNE